MQTAKHTGETPGTTDEEPNRENNCGCAFCPAAAAGIDAETGEPVCSACADRPLVERVDEQATVSFDIEPSRTGRALFSIRHLRFAYTEREEPA